jgi:hypothetical protein
MKDQAESHNLIFNSRAQESYEYLFPMKEFLFAIIVRGMNLIHNQVLENLPLLK